MPQWGCNISMPTTHWTRSTCQGLIKNCLMLGWKVVTANKYDGNIILQCIAHSTPTSSWTSEVRSDCMPRWQPCVRAQATLYKKKHYLPVMKATKSDSKRCQVSVDGCFPPITKLFPAEESTYLLIPSKRRSATSPVVGWRPVQTASQPSLRRQRFDVCMTTADHGKNANWCTAVSMCACHKCRISCQGADQSIPTGGGIMRRSIFRIKK